MTCERVRLPDRVDASLVARAAEAIAEGQLIALPTETVYGLTLRPGHEAAARAASALKKRPEEQVYTFHVADRGDLARLAPPPGRGAQQLMDRYWPGPLTLILPRRGGGTVGVRMPAHDFTRAVIAAAGEPLWMTSINRSGDPPCNDPERIEREFGHALALLFDDGVPPLGVASTIVDATGPELQVRREGILSAHEVFTTAARRILFVCTGNTCRSPLAVVMARDAAARHWQVTQDRVLPRGLAFSSAGTNTYDGMPASEGSLLAAGEIGLDLGDHQSRQFDAALADVQHLIYCMSGSHLRALRALAPDAAARAELLDPDGHDIVDPYGGELADYRHARDAIQRAIARRLPEWTRA